MVKISKAKEQSEAVIEEFFQTRVGKQETWEHEYGYFLELEGERIGFFVLYPLEGGGCWLRRLMMCQGIKPAAYVMAFDWAAEKATSLGYESIYVHARTEEAVPLLEMNRFKQTENPGVDMEDEVDWYMRRLNR
ncbi:hypothetical protein CEY16_07315 [Halalkalibacillus sediminis]|uniref:N-acetyltransferase domain-containing protein n=1 Tax=Halalkalibacillus sediminis TaxID=2018042 RepID=A0A2I0QTQ9_9BACI|nr:hypothetical protein [Halalkalibacillus sediminis]PKR77732.1 hypothetical protein CEY16_07315 [Halalkalibacillus sediminis]